MEYLNSLKHPQYTGANRCYPCTVVNIAIALFLTGALVGFFAFLFTIALSLAIGSIFFLSSILIIWLRGYLIPGTPSLTKQYAPRWLLAIFGKETVPASMLDTKDGEDIDPEELLLEADLVRQDVIEDDFVLTEEFVSCWEEQESDPEHPERQFASIFGVPEDTVNVHSLGDGDQLRIAQQRVLIWPSDMATRADLQSGLALRSMLGYWQELPLGHQAALIAGVRIVLPHCPDGTDTKLNEETVESCCRSYDVVAVICGESEARLYEHTI